MRCPTCGLESMLGEPDDPCPRCHPAEALASADPRLARMHALEQLSPEERVAAAAPYLLAAIECTLDATREPLDPRGALARVRLAALSAYVLAKGVEPALAGLRHHR